MFCLGRNLSGVESVVADFAFSDWDPKHLGRKSAPYMIKVEQGAIEKASYAAGIARPLLADSGALAAPFPYYWHLINNTPTYRKYETYVQHGVPDNVAHLHTGDDYRAYHPIVPGDTITVTVELTRLQARQGRQGPMKFVEDIWQFRNQDNVLAGELVRKVATIYYTDAGTTGVPDLAPDIASMLRPEQVHVIAPGMAARPGEDLFSGNIAGYAHDIGPVSWTMMVQWMGAVDDYARTHYDFDYARERGFPGGMPITAGPHMGALMLAPLMAWVGPSAWIEEFNHVQRHPVNPNERLSTFGVIDQTRSSADRIWIDAWLLDDARRVRNWGSFVVRRR